MKKKPLLFRMELKKLKQDLKKKRMRFVFEKGNGNVIFYRGNFNLGSNSSEYQTFINEIRKKVVKKG